MVWLKNSLVAFVLMVTSYTSVAADLYENGLSVGNNTRVIFYNDVKSVSVPITNNSEINFLVYSVVLDGLDGEPVDDFIVTPEVTKIKAKSSSSIVLRKYNELLNTERERLFYLSVTMIPDANQKFNFKDGGVSYSYEFKQKIFIRPDDLNGNNVVERYSNDIKFNYIDNLLVVENSSPIYVTFYELFIDGILYELNQNQRMLAPNTKMLLNFEKCPEIIKFSLINDSGFSTETFTTTINL